MTRKLADMRRLLLRVAAASVGSAAFSACGGGTGDALASSEGGASPTPAAPPPTSPPPAAGTRVVINAGPSDYLAKLQTLQPGDTLMLASGNYGVDAQGNDTASPPGLPVFNLNGSAAAPIVISGPAAGPRPVLMGRSTHNTIRFANASHIVIRRLEVNGRDRGGSGVATQGPSNNITLEDNVFRGVGSDQQVVAISTTGQPTWGWVVRRNLIVGAGTGIYFGNSNGDSPFVAGLIEYNVILDSVGYCLQVKHQTPWGAVPGGMPTGKTTTIVRHNVFAKSGNSATGENARPNLLLGDQPPSGPGSTNGFAVYGNFFNQNPGEALFQAEGNFAFYDNLLVTSGTAMRVQQHNGSVRDVRIFHNTVVAGGSGISVSGGAPGYTQQVLANAVFAAGAAITLAGAGASATDNIADSRINAPAYLNNPLASIGALDLFGKPAKLNLSPVNLAGLEVHPDWNRDFNGNPRDATFRGAYSGAGTNPGWTLVLEQKPLSL